MIILVSLSSPVTPLQSKKHLSMAHPGELQDMRQETGWMMNSVIGYFSVSSWEHKSSFC